MAADPASGEPAVPAELVEDLEDLKAQVQGLSARVETLQAQGAVGPGGDQEQPEAGQAPPFILLLDTPAYEEELRGLIEWVEGVLVPCYLEEPSAEARWCPQWMEHPVAVARLHALWLAWQELTDPASGGHTGPSTWHRDHYAPCIRQLRAPVGPFQGCTKGEHQIHHRLPGLVLSVWRSQEAEPHSG